MVSYKEIPFNKLYCALKILRVYVLVFYVFFNNVNVCVLIQLIFEIEIKVYYRFSEHLLRPLGSFIIMLTKHNNNIDPNLCIRNK